MIEIKRLNKKQLLEYVQSPHFGKGDDIPISVHRALSQTVNPRLNEEDILLILALDDGDLMGYAGIIPDLLFLQDETTMKIGWLSCIWVSTKARGKGIGIKLVRAASDAWNKSLLGADYVPAIKVLYDRTKLFLDDPYTKEGIRLYIRSDLQHILPPKKEIFQRYNWLLKAIDYGANGLLNLRLKIYQQDLSNIHFEYVDHIDDEVNAFILSKQSDQLFKRRKDDLNWFLQNPWILSADTKSDLNKKYYFTSTVKSFFFKALIIRDSNREIIAFLIFSVRDNSLKLPYLYHDNCLDIVTKVINHHLIKWNIHTFTILHPGLASHLQTAGTPAIYARTFKRNYIVSSGLQDPLFNSGMVMQDGDGDCGFT